jgi:hypothetical protein
MKNPLDPDRIYGFRVEMLNKGTYDPGDEFQWAMKTADVYNNDLDASDPAARFNPAQMLGAARGWGVYRLSGDASAVSVTFSSLLPTATFGAVSSVTIFPIQLPSTVTTTCRLVAPDGYQLFPKDFLYHYSSVPGATATWPGQVPWQSQQANPGMHIYDPNGDQAANVLLWSSATYSHNEKYGFTSKVSIPATPITATTRAFFLQFGWDGAELATRPLAYVLPIPEVRTLTNFQVGYLTNVVGAINYATIAVVTATTIPAGGELKVTAPAGFIFEERCTPESVAGEERVPQSLACVSALVYGEQAVVTGTVIRFIPSEPLRPRRLVTWVRVYNPVEPRTNRPGQATECGFEECWTVAAVDEQGLATDTPTTTPGFALNRQMVEAKLVDLNYLQRLATARSDRPGSENNVIFAFRLNQQPSSVGDLLLSGPYGFTFEEDCMPGLRIYQTELYHTSVFGFLEWIPGYDEWEAAAKVRSCVSTGPSARMLVELGLRASKLYVFRIHVSANPLQAAEQNKWTIEYASESCVPFEGFELWTFADFSLTATVTAATSDTHRVPNPITFRFRPHKEVNADPTNQGIGGLLRIVAPIGFVAVAKGILG